MDNESTIPVRNSGLPLRKLRVIVDSGPDAGAAASTADSLTVGTADGNVLVLTDPTVSKFHLELERAEGLVRVRDLGSTNGSAVGPALVKNGYVEVPPGTALKLGNTMLTVADGETVLVELGPRRLGDLRAAHPSMRQLFSTVERIAGTEVPVLILGESGTGKELVARAIHDRSPRAEHPFVTLDCGWVSPNLFSAELFGHEKGAFTGADRRKPGAFERANGGTLFLDEIGELPADLQPALLGVLERGRIQRVGGTEEIAVNVRVVSATHRDLFAEVNLNEFRLDLFYRLSVVRLEIPPLRDRPDDIPELVEHFLREIGFEGPVESVFDSEQMKRLTKHSWPGNVRELRNVVHGTLALGQPPELVPIDGSPGGDPISAVLTQPYRAARRMLLDEFERRFIQNLLTHADGNIRQAARDGKMDRTYLMELMRRHGLR